MKYDPYYKMMTYCLLVNLKLYHKTRNKKVKDEVKLWLDNGLDKFLEKTGIELSDKEIQQLVKSESKVRKAIKRYQRT